MQDPYKIITDFLDQKNIPFEIIEHEPVYTSEQAANVRGLSLKQGGKSLLLKADNNFILVIIPGDKRLDSKKLKKLMGIRNLRFANPEEVKEVMKCEVGACYPFGNLIGIKMMVDRLLSRNEVISFNPGVHNKSIKMKWKDYFEAVKPELIEVSI
ncbi:MAG: hypothetical protein HYV38_01860 [Candidatus Levybacteria bacterium]|nr:hypothetical protein [Candidatus Levybacteria bacterium]MBI2420806.1 hypothetical protein [Candidatus Levybacteria bacterium]MBI4097643.1 hypothetical protein [Candidatus Levybacteria bacterium]